jgi:hypothetical protein
MEIRLTDILKLANFDSSIPTKLVRHIDARVPLENLRQNVWNGEVWLDLYQGYQKGPVFHRVRQIVSFYGLAGTRAGFYGVYKVLGHVPAGEGPEIPPSEKWGVGCNFFYKLQRDQQFDGLRDRLIIDWGKGAINWHQHLNEKQDKEVLELLAPGRSLPPFVDYLKFSLRFSQLKDLFRHEDAHRDWRVPLEGVAGVYLVLAEKSGEIYVGSAYGTEGIWGRWREYAKKDGHAGNIKLQNLVNKDPACVEGFRFSVLQILPKSTSKGEVLEWEKLYKKKLGSRAIGLNCN